jgi:hypothetical protein
MTLSKKRQLFVNEYLKTFNATQAARAAGYSGNDNVMAQRGYELVRNPQIAEMISDRLTELEKDLPNEIILGLRKKLKKKVSKAGFLYLIKAPNDLVKIGIAKDVKKRFSSINTASPVNLKLLWSCQCKDAREIEKHLHDKFAIKRIKGEWFNLNGHDISWIKENVSFEYDKSDNPPTVLNYKVRQVDVNPTDYEQSSMFD